MSLDELKFDLTCFELSLELADQLHAAAITDVDTAQQALETAFKDRNRRQVSVHNAKVAIHEFLEGTKNYV